MGGILCPEPCWEFPAEGRGREDPGISGEYLNVLEKQEMRTLHSRWVESYFFLESSRAGWDKPGEKWASACTGSHWGKHRTRGRKTKDKEDKKALNSELVEGSWEERGLPMEQINRGCLVSNSFPFY